MCSFVPALTPSCAPICCGACNCTNPSASKQQPGKRARGCWWDQYTCREEGWLGPSPWKRPACQRPVDFSYGLYSDIEFLRLWGKPKHYYSVMISLHLLSLSPYWFNSEPFLPSSLTPFFFPPRAPSLSRCAFSRYFSKMPSEPVLQMGMLWDLPAWY